MTSNRDHDPERVRVQLVFDAYAGLFAWARRRWDSVTLRAKRRKCIVSGCEIPARGRIGYRILSEPWTVCGFHRASVANVINEAQSSYHYSLAEITHKRARDLTNGLNALGCHEDELTLAG